MNLKEAVQQAKESGNVMLAVQVWRGDYRFINPHTEGCGGLLIGTRDQIEAWIESHPNTRYGMVEYTD